ncbi:LysR family transcriptional regulator [Raoultella terrigena]|uniref:LysR family transcriptional regulator n=1 Tax=Raoultella terrigena TaxID=577 RepID=UPI0015BA5C2F|nr:LysR family transcriptional regulator [Raoultella terrigena]NWK85977.1 LysR family transcriptional regulator [Raoultella terrigena]
MREINLDQLRTLITIADTGSFNEAARQLHLAPPTVSLHISELEGRVGAKLLSRTRGKVRPTAIGENMVAHARRLLADVAYALDDISRQAQGLTGQVRLGASTGAIAYLLPQALEKLAQSHPHIDVHITILTSQQTLEQLKSGSLDIGIVALPQPRSSGLKIDAWRRDPVVAFLPADWTAPEFVTPEWMIARPLLLNGSGTHLSQLTNGWFADTGHSPTPRIKLDYNDAIKSLVGAGYGATLLPLESGTQLAAASRIAIRPLQPPLWRELGLAWRESENELSTQHLLSALRELRQA